MNVRIFLALVTVALACAAQPTPVAVSIPTELTTYLSVLSYGTPEYDSALGSVSPGLSSTGISPLLPYSVILRNASSEFLRGFNVVFWVQNGGGTTLPYSFASVELDGAKSGLLPPGGLRLVSILPAANHAVERNDVAGLTALPPTMSAISAMAAELGHSLSIQLTVEAIVTQNGAFIGPDRLGLLSRIQGEQSADAFIAAKLNAAGSLPAMVSALETLSATPTDPSPNPFTRDFYSDRLARTASELLTLINAGTQSQPANFASRVGRKITVSRQ